jgi:hypothetical protein
VRDVSSLRNSLFKDEAGFASLNLTMALVRGSTTKRHTSGKTIAKPKETKMGRITVTASNEDVSPRFEMTWTMINPTISSIMAADVNTTPRRLELRPLVLRRVKVVPRLVAQRAEPAAKACSGEAPIMGESTNDRPIGVTMPVMATSVESQKFAFNAEKDVDNPPGTSSERLQGS